MVDETEILEHKAHFSAHIRDFTFADVADVLTVNEHLTLVRALLTGDELQKGTFARAAGTDDKDELAFFDLQVDVVQRFRTVIVNFRNIAEFDQSVLLLWRYK